MASTTTPVNAAVPLVSHLVVAALCLAAGVLLGGWVAFETGYWGGFKTAIEGLAGVVPALVTVLLLLAVGLSAATTYVGLTSA